MTLRIPVIVGTVREGRESIKAARYVHGRLSARRGVASTFIDPADLPLGNLVAREWEMDEKPPILSHLVESVGGADAFVIVAPEYNHGYPGALKNLIDFIYDEWNGKAFGIVSTGGAAGGARMAEQLKQVILALQGVPVPGSVAIPRVGEAFDEEGEPTNPRLPDRVDRFLDEVVRYAAGTRKLRERAHAPAAGAR